MLVFLKARLVFLAVPKTGTTAWETALAPLADIAFRAPPRLKHMTLRRFQAAIAPMLTRAGIDRLETLAVIREPEDWLGSWYRYRRRPGLAGRPQSTRGVDFDTFVRACIGTDRPAYADLGSQARFVEPWPSGRPVDHLFAHDRPEALAAFLESRLGTVVLPERHNQSPPATLALSADTRARLRAARLADFELYERVSGTEPARERS